MTRAATTYHLLKDFGIYKQTVVRNFRDNDRGSDCDRVRDLLAKRTQRYTLDELRVLAGFFWTAHDECVTTNPADFTAIEVYTADRKIENGTWAIQKISELESCAVPA